MHQMMDPIMQILMILFPWIEAEHELGSLALFNLFPADAVTRRQILASACLFIVRSLFILPPHILIDLRVAG